MDSGHAQPAADQAADQNAPGILNSDAFDGSAPIYQWSDEYGDVGPKIESLEIELFGDPATRHERTGLDFRRIASIEVSQEGPVKIQAINSFKDAGLHPVMLENVQLAGYDHPTPIQKFTIPAIVQGRDVIGIAQTGTVLMGKAKKLAAPRPNPVTFCEGRDEVTAEPLVLIVAPTRELAVQIFNEARKFCYRTMLRPGVVYGGVPLVEQVNQLNRGCDVLIGTPGRLVAFIEKPRVLSLRRLRYLIIDEADEMLDVGWQEDLQRIMLGGDQDDGNVKYGFFSATFPKQARDMAKEHLAAAHVRFRVGRAGSTTENIKQIVVKVEPHEKRDVLLQLLNEMHGIRTIIFVNSRQEVDFLDDFLFNMRLPVTSMHSDRTQLEREAAMRSFRAGTAPIMVATGVTARGIDVRNVMHVINFDLPSMDHGGIEEYTHRIGRTGRIGHRGVATSLFTDRDEPIASVLTRTLLETNQEIPDFLQIYKPEVLPGKAIKFETESDYDPNEVQDGGQDTGEVGETGETGDAWGGAAQAENGAVPQSAAWGEWNSATSAVPRTAPDGWNSATSAALPAAPSQNQAAAQSWGGSQLPATIPGPTGLASQAWGVPATW
ncbi:hypothetical protein NHJ13051_004171 [Beauveria bassiana]